MAESVFVEYSGTSVRDVFVDGTRLAFTGEVFNVETGTHTFDLGLPADYTPSAVTKQVTNTAPLDPLVLQFEPKVLPAAPPPAPPPPTPAAPSPVPPPPAPPASKKPSSKKKSSRKKGK